MQSASLLIVLVLLISLGLGLTRIALGPTVADSLLGVQFTSTIGIALLPLIGIMWGVPALVDIALVLAVLGVPATLAFLRYDRRHNGGDGT
ncbi:MAG: multiple resistance and pH regulation protein F [Candidatus Hydrogenedentes bacterium]|nr:multiple resistance and pH regulation protein F [Candidatus Hydrogenedentota bacterium]